MKERMWYSLCIMLSALLLLGLTAGANAQMIVLAGDENLIDRLATDPGNQAFFRNVLGGGDSVLVLGSTNFFYGPQANDTNTFYNSLPGVTSTLLPGGSPVTAGDLAGVDLLVSLPPTSDFTAPELSAMNSFLSGGGTLFFMGEWWDYDSTGDTYINNALTALGSGLQLVSNTNLDLGFHTASGSQIVSDPLTAGVSTLTFAASSQVRGGTTLLFASTGEPIITYEGSHTQAVPEPGALSLLAGSGLAGLGLLRRRRA